MSFINEYNKLYLKENPFPRNEAEQYISKPEKLKIVLFDYERRLIENIASDIKNTTASFVVTGPWGTGKSLFLLYLYKKLIELYGKNNVRLIYVKAPESINDVLDRIMIQLDLKTKKNMKPEEKIREIRGKINTLIEDKNKVIYIALDQLETFADKILNKPDETRKLAELLRSHLSTVAARKYILGISAIHVTWANLKERWRSLEGITEINLRPLRREEVPLFIEKYLQDARLINKENLHIFEENPLFPFTAEAVDYISEASRGVQRTICALAHMSIEYAIKNNLDEIGVETVMVAEDPKKYIWSSLNNQYKYSYFRAIKIINEIIGYYSLRSNSNIQFISKINNRTILIYDRINKKYVLIVYVPRKIDIKYLNGLIAFNKIKPLRIADEEIVPDKVNIIIFVGKNQRYDKIIPPKASLMLTKLADKVNYNVVHRDSIKVWGRLVALYAGIKNELYGYLESELEIRKEIYWFLENIIGIKQEIS